jgi:hypothetical protein
MHTVVVSYLAAAIICVSRSYGSKSRSPNPNPKSPKAMMGEGNGLEED